MSYVPPITLTVEGSLVILRFVARDMHAPTGYAPPRAPGPYCEFAAGIQCGGDTHEEFLRCIDRACARLLECARVTMDILENGTAAAVPEDAEVAPRHTPGTSIHRLKNEPEGT